MNAKYQPRNAGQFALILSLKEQILSEDHDLSLLGKIDHEKQIEIVKQRIEEMLERPLSVLEQDLLT